MRAEYSFIAIGGKPYLSVAVNTEDQNRWVRNFPLEEGLDSNDLYVLVKEGVSCTMESFAEHLFERLTVEHGERSILSRYKVHMAEVALHNKPERHNSGD